jgi:hypothetical protein
MRRIDGLAAWILCAIPLVAALATETTGVDRILRYAYATDPPGETLHFDYYFHKFYAAMARPVLFASGATLLALLVVLRAIRSPRRASREPHVPAPAPDSPRTRGKSDLAAGSLALLAFAAAALVGQFVLADFPNSADEWAFRFQAHTFAQGEAFRDATAHPLVPELGTGYYVTVKEGKWFAIIFPGWPALLSTAIRLGFDAYLNPLLGAIAIWFTYLAGRTLFGAREALIAALICGATPFFLLNSASYFSQPASLACVSIALYLTSRSITAGAVTAAVAAGAAMGACFNARPLTALAIGATLTIALLFAGGRRRESRRVAMRSAGFVGAFLILVIPFLVYNHAITADFLTTPYAWSGNRDVPGFFRNGYTVHTPTDGFVLTVGHLLDLWAWMPFGTLPIAILAFIGRRGWRELLLGGLTVALIGAYWAFVSYGGNQYGPRYYYEALPALAILIARGATVAVADLRGRLDTIRFRRFLVAAAGAMLVGHVAASVWFLAAHARIVSQRIAPFVLAEENGLENAVVLLDTGSGTMELLDLVRNDPCCSEGVVWAPSPRAVADLTGPRAAHAYAERLRAAYPGRNFWTFRYEDPLTRGPEWACVRWPLRTGKPELTRVPGP